MRFLLGGLCLCCAADTAHAQIFIGGGAFERGLRPGYNIPSDGQPFSHRYGYTTGMSTFYFGHAGWRMGYLEYLDRIDRAEKFGYPIPWDSRYEFPTVYPQAEITKSPAAPAAENAVESTPVAERRVGIGLGIFRRR